MAPQLHAINMPSRGDSELTTVAHKLCSSPQRMSSEIHNVTRLLLTYFQLSTLIIVELSVSGPRSAAKRLTHFSQRKLGELQAENSVRLGSVRSFALSLSLSLSFHALTSFCHTLEH